MSYYYKMNNNNNKLSYKNNNKNNNKYNNNKNNNKNDLNTFSIVDFPQEGMTYGQFKDNIPKKAAEQAFTYLFNIMSEKDKIDFTGKFIVFVIKNNNNGKLYKYLGNRIKLKNPVKKYEDGKYVYYYYKNVIGKYRPELDLL
jgi:hypothetical protein